MYPVAAFREPTKELEEMKLRPAGVGIFQILPVGQENIHNRPSVRATLSSTPFTNAADCTPPKRWAR